MSQEKYAGFLTGLKSWGKDITKEVKRTNLLHEIAGRDEGLSLHRFGLEMLNSNEAFGADTLSKAVGSFQRGVNKADVALGAAIRGKAKPGSIWHSIWTDKKQVPMKRTMFGTLKPDLGENSYNVLDRTQQAIFGKPTRFTREMETASISKPVKAVGAFAIPMLAWGKWDDISQKLRSKQPEGGPLE